MILGVGLPVNSVYRGFNIIPCIVLDRVAHPSDGNPVHTHASNRMGENMCGHTLRQRLYTNVQTQGFKLTLYLGWGWYSSIFGSCSHFSRQRNVSLLE
jgi:hypothetical protein